MHSIPCCRSLQLHSISFRYAFGNCHGDISLAHRVGQLRFKSCKNCFILAFKVKKTVIGDMVSQKFFKFAPVNKL